MVFPERRALREFTFSATVYNTRVGSGPPLRMPPEQLLLEGAALIRCPDCAAEIDVDEDEVEEGEILNCPECEMELEVVQTHPVKLNLISDELDDEDDEEEDDEEDDEEDEKKEDEEDEIEEDKE